MNSEDDMLWEDLLALSREVGDMLREQGLTLATAESCTGGLVGHIVTEIPGSSDYFVGGVISYSNDVKHRILGVPQEILDTVGAVSPECARAMAHGARNLLRADIAVSITGIAGPSGGTPEKPVGLTYFHIVGPDAEWGEHHVWQGNRHENKLASARNALEMVRAYLSRHG